MMKRPANCTTCRQEMVSAIEDYVYDESALSDVVLGGIEVRRCTNGKCELRGVAVPVIPNIEGLHAALARAIIEQPARLSGDEVRFLRTHLGLRGVDFARVMGVAKETVSRWENDPADPIGPQADRALRLLVLNQKPINDYSPEALTELLQKISDTRRPTGLRAERRPGAGWRAQEAS